jgi:ArsR family transcriptional regulator, arsenate/arsenite/antimonite-responsive transcriptional repressor
MNEAHAIEAFSALGQETRLATFRMLVRAGPDGITSGEIGERLGVRQNTMSTNLGILLAAGLVTRNREGRAVRYYADMEGYSAVLNFLISDCCGGRPELCKHVLSEIHVPLPAN